MTAELLGLPQPLLMLEGRRPRVWAESVLSE
jgi:hypothetical protein